MRALRRKAGPAGPRAAEEPRKVNSDPTNYWLGSVDVSGNLMGAVLMSLGIGWEQMQCGCVGRTLFE